MNYLDLYIKHIIELLQNCEDMELLDFIFQMLKQRQELPSPLGVSRE